MADQGLFTNAGFCSIVAEMYPLNAAHRFDTAGAGAGCFVSSAAFFVSATGLLLLLKEPAAAPCCCCVCAAAETVDNCAMLTPNLAISPLNNLSFLFSAPLLLLKLWCLILPSRTSAAPSPSASSGRASARLSSELSWFFVVDFEDRRRVFDDFEMRLEDEATREMKAECLMVRLSRLVERKESVVEALGRNVFGGARGWIAFVMRAWRRAVADGFRGAFFLFERCWN